MIVCPPSIRNLMTIAALFNLAGGECLECHLDGQLWGVVEHRMQWRRRAVSSFIARWGRVSPGIRRADRCGRFLAVVHCNGVALFDLTPAI